MLDRRERTDAQLVAAAVDGDAGAYAALLHRHAARVDAVVGEDADPDSRVVEVFATAMTRLADAPEDVGTWLESIARAAVGRHHDEPATAAAPSEHGEIDPDRLDAIWRELSRRWPSGRTAPHIPAWLPWATTAAVTIALSAGIPWWLLGPDAPEPDLMELRAFPLIEGPEVATDEPDPLQEIPLPTFEFPAPPEEPEEPVQPPDPAPDAEPDPDTGDADTPGDENDDEDDGTEGGDATDDDAVADDGDVSATGDAAEEAQ